MKPEKKVKKQSVKFVSTEECSAMLANDENIVARKGETIMLFLRIKEGISKERDS